MDNKLTTNQISACFEGDSLFNAIAWVYIFDRERYAACTTTQFGYKPAFNTTSLTVEPQSTEATVPTKTPEEMQQKAEDNGWLKHDRLPCWVQGTYKGLKFAFTLRGAKLIVE